MVVSGCRARMAIGTACIGAHERGRGERIGSMEQQRAEALRDKTLSKKLTDDDDGPRPSYVLSTPLYERSRTLH